MSNGDVMIRNVMPLSNATVQKLLNCEYCSKSFPTNYRLKWHMLTHTKEKVRSLNCEHCSKSFYSHSHLKQHSAMHSGRNHITVNIVINPSLGKIHLLHI